MLSIIILPLVLSENHLRNIHPPQDHRGTLISLEAESFNLFFTYVRYILRL